MIKDRLASVRDPGGLFTILFTALILLLLVIAGLSGDFAAVASSGFFSKSVVDLTVAESILILASIAIIFR